MRAKRVPSDIWERQVLVGTDENGEKIYKTFSGESEEEVNEKAREYQRKKMLDRQNKWQSENKERVSVVLDKGTRERIDRSGSTLNGFIREAVDKELKRLGL